MSLAPQDYIALLEDGRKHNKTLGQLEALGQAVELMVQIAHEWEMSGVDDREFIASQRLIREVVELKNVISQTHFKN